MPYCSVPQYTSNRPLKNELLKSSSDAPSPRQIAHATATHRRTSSAESLSEINANAQNGLLFLRRALLKTRQTLADSRLTWCSFGAAVARRQRLQEPSAGHACGGGSALLRRAKTASAKRILPECARSFGSARPATSTRVRRARSRRSVSLWTGARMRSLPCCRVRSDASDASLY